MLPGLMSQCTTPRRWRVVQRVRDLGGEGGGAHGLHRRIPRDQLAQRLAGHVLHDDVRLLALNACVIHIDDVRGA